MGTGTLPVFLDVTGLKVLFVGAGTAAVAKWPALLDSGARVVVVAPEVHTEARVHLPNFEYHCRRFQDSDLDQAVLVYAFTNDNDVNQKISQRCRERGIWHNTAGNRGPGAFTSPAVARHENLTLAVGSSGQAPGLAVRWRDHFASQWGET